MRGALGLQKDKKTLQKASCPEVPMTATHNNETAILTAMAAWTRMMFDNRQKVFNDRKDFIEAIKESMYLATERYAETIEVMKPEGRHFYLGDRR